MRKKILGEQKYSFRQIRNLEELSEGLHEMIEKLRIIRPENELKSKACPEVIYHPLGKINDEENLGK